MSHTTEDIRKLRMLVAIASYGSRQLEYLRQVIASFKSMTMSVDIVVLSNEPKDLGKDVGVVVGLPSKNPFSLPFAHKPVFAENVDRYDLFAYVEDDVLVTEAHIRAFLRATRVLPEDEIAGHLRYEMTPAGEMWMAEIFGPFRWKPESVRVRGGHTFAEYTNEHAAFYVLTQNQLKRAIKSGGFLRSPHHGRYGMLESAATDPFTSCGFRKVICISQIDDFLLHHMSNRYAGKSGISRETLNRQIAAMMKIQSGTHPASSLCPLETKMAQCTWSKTFYEPPQEELIRLVPPHAKNVLSVGCGWGTTEAALRRNGTSVTALPVDSVIGAVAEERGIEVIYGTLEEGLKRLAGRKFDCVLMDNLLHLLPEQRLVLEACPGLLQKDGTFVVCGPNFARLPLFIKRNAGWPKYRKQWSFKESGINVCGPRTVARYARNAGLRVIAVNWINHQLPGRLAWTAQCSIVGGVHADSTDNRLSVRRLAGMKMDLGPLTAKNWIIQCKK